MTRLVEVQLLHLILFFTFARPTATVEILQQYKLHPMFILGPVIGDTGITKGSRSKKLIQEFRTSKGTITVMVFDVRT